MIITRIIFIHPFQRLPKDIPRLHIDFGRIHTQFSVPRLVLHETLPQPSPIKVLNAFSSRIFLFKKRIREFIPRHIEQAGEFFGPDADIDHVGIKQDQFHFRIHAITFARITIIPKIAAFAFLGDIHGNLVTHPEQRVVIFIFGMLGLPDHRPSC